MNALVIGSGGREHALCRALKRDARGARLFCVPGNAGIAEEAECVPLSATDVPALADFAERERVELTIVGGEAPLAAGLADEFARRGLLVAGPKREAARLESSKAFAKDFMLRHNVPTARHRVASSAVEARDILRSGEFGPADSPVVVKADGLAAGKGVVVARTRIEAEQAIREMMLGLNARERDDGLGRAEHRALFRFVDSARDDARHRRLRDIYHKGEWFAGNDPIRVGQHRLRSWDRLRGRTGSRPNRHLGLSRRRFPDIRLRA